MRTVILASAVWLTVFAAGCGGGGGGGGDESPESGTHAPVAVGQTVRGVEDEVLPLTLLGSDTEDRLLSYRIVTACTYGTLSGTPPELIYHPAPDFAGTDTFTFEVDDGTSVSAPAVVSIQVENRNDLPVVERVVVTEQQLGKVVVTCTLRDPDDEPCSLVVEYRRGSTGAAWQPATVSGDLTGLLPGEPYSIVWDVMADEADCEAGTYQVRLTPWDAVGEGQAGETESFSVLADGCDSGGEEEPDTGVPVAVGMTLSGVEDEPLPITLEGVDDPATPLVFGIVTPCSHGTLSGTPPELIYQPDPDFAGTDTFTFAVDDGTSVSDPAVVSIQVENRNDLPVVEQVVVAEQQLGKVVVTCTLQDPDDEPCSLVVEYRGGSAGGDWQPATVIGDLTGLIPGEPCSIVWDVEADEAAPEAGTYQVRLTPWDAAGEGQAGETESFSVQFVRPLYFVAGDAPEGGDGLTWATAFRHPQEAVDANLLGARIWVARGTYTVLGGDQTASVLTMMEGAAFYGGFAGTETVLAQRDTEANVTVLDGEGTARHVVLGADDALLDGFTVTGGNAQGEPLVSIAETSGGGVLLYEVATTLANCRFVDNSAGWMGGGVFVYGAAAEIRNCVFERNSAYDGAALDITEGGGLVEDSTFRDNTAQRMGGALEIWQGSGAVIRNCEFDGNSGERGGGIIMSGATTATITGCRIRNNSAVWGGGINNADRSYPVIVDCTIEGNTATLVGGGMVNTGMSAATVERCIFAGNRSEMSGGGVGVAERSSNVTLTNCLFEGNYAAEFGGGVFNTSASPRLINCTFADNSSDYLGGAMHNFEGSFPFLANCVVWGNTSAGYADYPIRDMPGTSCSQVSLASVTYSIALHSGSRDREVTNEDPLFVARGYWDDNATPGDDSDDYWVRGDYRLQAGSPAIDSANGDLAPAQDANGDSRWNDPVAPDRGVGNLGYTDMGAYEYQGQ